MNKRLVVFDNREASSARAGGGWADLQRLLLAVQQGADEIIPLTLVVNRTADLPER